VGEQLLAQLSEASGRTALFFDVDGTLAPIVRVPEDARVPQGTREELVRLVERYALVACVSGRAGDDAARRVGVEGIRYVGSHGLELEPAAERWREVLQEFASRVAWPVENKGLTLSFHYRGAPDEEGARAELELVAERARDEDLEARFGRKVLELRPPVQADKGTALLALLAETTADRALYAGDDTTDLDAFRALYGAGLDVAVRVAVSSSEAPEALLAEADLVVSGPSGLVELLHIL